MGRQEPRQLISSIAALAMPVNLGKVSGHGKHRLLNQINRLRCAHQPSGGSQEGHAV